MGHTEKWDEFAPVRFDAVCFEVRCGYSAVVEMDWHVVRHLNSVLDTEEPEFHWEVMFSEVISGYVAKIFPVGFCEAVFILAVAWSAGRESEVVVEELGHYTTDEFEVTIC